MPSTEGSRTATLRFLAAHLSANVQMALELRGSFAVGVLSMILNDAMWLVFWWLYFTRFPVVRGWTRGDVVVLWAVLATAFGLANGLLGNASRLSQIIVTGDLDYYLTLPKPVLPHILVGRLAIMTVGDLLFGPAVFLAFGHPTPARAALFVVVVVLAAMVILGFEIAVHSLAFWLGSADTVAAQLFNALIHFSSYPSAVFEGATKLVLFTVVPAGFLNMIPVHVMRVFDPAAFAALCGAAAVFMGGGAALFSAGLRRYESGNLIGGRA